MRDKRLNVIYIVLTLLLFGALWFFAGCKPIPSPTPTPTPTPTPEPAGRPDKPVFTDLLLRQTDGKLSRPIIGAIPCWPSCDDGCLKVDGKPVDYWWSLASPGWIDAVKPKGVNAIHIRLGPVRAVDQCCGMQEVGGPYQETPMQTLRKLNPKARRVGEQWNQKYWDRVHQVIRHAGEQGFLVEADCVDSWTIKHAQWGDFAMPWPASDVVNASAVPLNPSLGAWIDKVVYELREYGNVIFEISNESEGLGKWTPEWERAIHARIRAGETDVVHMIGSNTSDYDGPYDYFEVHNSGSFSPVAGRPVGMNEWNPHMTPASFAQQCKDALAQGTFCWYWRSDGSDADQDASLNSILGPIDTGCPDPKPDRNRLEFGLNCDANNNCDSTPLNAGDLSYCQAIGMGEYNGQPRATCPVRPECAFDSPPDAICHSRLACEQFDIGGSSPVFSSDGSWRYVDAGHFRVKVDGGTYLQACNVEGTRCSRVALH